MCAGACIHACIFSERYIHAHMYAYAVGTHMHASTHNVTSVNGFPDLFGDSKVHLKTSLGGIGDQLGKILPPSLYPLAQHRNAFIGPLSY